MSDEQNENPVEEVQSETVSDAIEESRPEVDGTDESTDDEVVEQSETVGEDAAAELTPEEEESERRRDIQRNFAGNEGEKSERKRQTNTEPE